MNTIREIQKINEEELSRGIAGTSASWHDKYAQSAWVYIGNLDHSLSEGDVLCILSQFGEVTDISLVREEETGKSKGFCFGKYEDARSCVLAVDNFCGVQVCGRSIRVDHVENYRLPKHLLEKEEAAASAAAGLPGHAYEGKELANEYSIDRGHDLFAPRQQQGDEAEPPEKKKKIGDKEAKRARKEERQRIREEKERRRRRKEERKESKRGRRSYSDGSDDSGKDDHRRKKHRRKDRRRSSDGSEAS